MKDLLTKEKVTVEFCESALDVLLHEHTTKNIEIVGKTTEALLVLKGKQDLLVDFAKYYVANVLQQNGALN